MTEKEVLALAKTDRAQARSLAELFDYKRVLRALDDSSTNPFQLAYAARFTIGDICKVTGIPSSTAQAASMGRVEGRMTTKQHIAFAELMWAKYWAMVEVLKVLDPKGAKEEGL